MALGLSLTIDSKDIEARFRRLSRRMADTTPLMRTIGAGLARNTRERFDAGAGPDGRAWAPLNPLYAAGKRGPGILRETRHLLGSIAFRAGRAMVELGSNLPYASIHQEGGVIRPRRAQRLAFRMGGPGKAGTSVFARQVTIPARPYLGLSARDRDTILDILEASLDPAG